MYKSFGDYAKYDYSIQEIWRLIKNVYGETIFNIYDGTVGTDSENDFGRESSNRQNDGILQRSEDGKRTLAESTKTNQQVEGPNIPSKTLKVEFLLKTQVKLRS